MRTGSGLAEAATIALAVFAVGMPVATGGWGIVIAVTALSNLPLDVPLRARRGVASSAVGALLLADTYVAGRAMNTESKRSVLVVDDDDVFRTRLVRALAERGLDARGANCATAAIASASAESPELAVVDLRMPDRWGLEVLRELRAIDPATSIVILTGYGSIATALEAVRIGATDYLTKPADADEILAAFDRPHRGSDPTPEIDHETPSLARTEWEHMQRVLTDCNGNLSQAARLLGLHRRSLQRKLAKRPASR